MSLKKLSVLVCLLVSACSSGDKNARYQDMARLETPPVIIDTSRRKIQSNEVEDITAKGLGDVVSLGKDKMSLTVTKSFGPSWEIVKQALRVSNIKVKDKNRTLGVFYVIYDPDDLESDDASVMDRMTFFLFKDEYEEMDYMLTLVEASSETKISVKQVDKDINDLLDDGEGYIEGTVDSGSKLITALYKTIKNDLSVK